jgi:hypothetical protein
VTPALKCFTQYDDASKNYNHFDLNMFVKPALKCFTQYDDASRNCNNFDLEKMFRDTCFKVFHSI